MSSVRVLAVCAVVYAVGCAGCGRQAPGPGSAYPPAAAATSGHGSAGRMLAITARWPESGILREDATVSAASQVLDPAAGVLFALVPATLTSGDGPYALQAIDLRTGRVRHGAPYPVSGLALVSGHLWVYGSTGRGGHPVLDEADPGTLAMIRPVPVPGGSGVDAVAPGPAGSVWVGTDRMLLRMSARTGAVLTRVALPPGFQLSDLAAGPGGRNVYTSAWRLRPGGIAVLVYSAGHGTLLARSDRVPLTWSVGWAELTAVPGGVWVWFRTGMLGVSALLSARSLSVVATAPAAATSAANSPVTGHGTIYSWASGSASAYAGGTLWVATAGGLLACVNPGNGTVRAQEVVKSQPAQPVITLAADPQIHQLAAVIGTPGGHAGVVSITPPRLCWS